jgi:cysteine-rich repeat protein
MPKTQLSLIASLLLLLGNASCFDTATTLCATGIRCPVDQGCAAKDPVCITGLCGNGITESDLGEICDDGGIKDGDGCSGDCLSLEVCGNGIPDEATGEDCDAAGESPKCDTDCSNAMCGDGTLNIMSGEECDSGGESMFCDTDCTIARCGDGLLNATSGESCDHKEESDKCDNDCTFAECLDGTFNMTSGEECDDGGDSLNCNIDCTAAECGDAYVNTVAGEKCDDGGETEKCNSTCTFAECGDGVLNTTAGEQCDSPDDPASCNTNCTTPKCGDGYVQSWRGEQCDAGAAHETASCDEDCTFVTCGDRDVNEADGEECDGGGETAFCDSTCTHAFCGDSETNRTRGEECDDGNNTDGNNGCTATCTYTEGYTCSPSELANLGAGGMSTGLTAASRPFQVIGNTPRVYTVPKPAGAHHLILPLVHSYDPNGDDNYAWRTAFVEYDDHVNIAIIPSRSTGNDAATVSGVLLVLGFDGVMSRFLSAPSNDLSGGAQATIEPQQTAVRTKVAPVAYATNYETNENDYFSWAIELTDAACATTFSSRVNNVGSLTWRAHLLLLSQAIRVEQLHFSVGDETIWDDGFDINPDAQRIWIPLVHEYENDGADELAYSVQCFEGDARLECTARAWDGGDGDSPRVSGRIIMLEATNGF